MNKSIVLYFYLQRPLFNYHLYYFLFFKIFLYFLFGEKGNSIVLSQHQFVNTRPPLVNTRTQAQIVPPQNPAQRICDKSISTLGQPRHRLGTGGPTGTILAGVPAGRRAGAEAEAMIRPDAVLEGRPGVDVGVVSPPTDLPSSNCVCTPSKLVLSVRVSQRKVDVCHKTVL